MKFVFLQISFARPRKSPSLVQWLTTIHLSEEFEHTRNKVIPNKRHTCLASIAKLKEWIPRNLRPQKKSQNLIPDLLLGKHNFHHAHQCIFLPCPLSLTISCVVRYSLADLFQPKRKKIETWAKGFSAFQYLRRSLKVRTHARGRQNDLKRTTVATSRLCWNVSHRRWPNEQPLGGCWRG